MRLRLLVAVLLLLVATVQAQGGCFPWQKRKKKANVLMAALAAQAMQQTAAQDDDKTADEGLEAPAASSHMEEITTDVLEAKEEMDEADDDKLAALRILVHVLEQRRYDRPRIVPHQETFNFCAQIEWSSTPMWKGSRTGVESFGSSVNAFFMLLTLILLTKTM